MENFYYQGACLSQEEMSRYKSNKLSFSDRRVIHKHIKACPICNYLYETTSSDSALKKTLTFVSGIFNFIPKYIAACDPSSLKNAGLIGLSVLITPFVLSATFKKGEATKPETHFPKQKEVITVVHQVKQMPSIVSSTIKSAKASLHISVKESKPRQYASAETKIIKLNTDSILKYSSID